MPITLAVRLVSVLGIEQGSLLSMPAFLASTELAIRRSGSFRPLQISHLARSAEQLGGFGSQRHDSFVHLLGSGTLTEWPGLSSDGRAVFFSGLAEGFCF